MNAQSSLFSISLAIRTFCPIYGISRCLFLVSPSYAIEFSKKQQLFPDRCLRFGFILIEFRLIWIALYVTHLTVPESIYSFSIRINITVFVPSSSLDLRLFSLSHRAGPRLAVSTLPPKKQENWSKSYGLCS